MSKVFLDTNVLIYAHDRSEPTKQARALDVIDYLASRGSGVISTQVLSEFVMVATRKLKAPLSWSEAEKQAERLMRGLRVVDVTAAIVLEAMRGVREYQFVLWDAQIWAAARLNQIPAVFSEDFNVDLIADGVRFVNPFAGDFRLTQWA